MNAKILSLLVVLFVALVTTISSTELTFVEDYCIRSQDCTFNNLFLIGNFSFLGNIVNVTIINQNITGQLTIGGSLVVLGNVTADNLIGELKDGYRIKNYSDEYAASGFDNENFSTRYDDRTDRWLIQNYSDEYSASGFDNENFSAQSNSLNSSLWNRTPGNTYLRNINDNVSIGNTNPGAKLVVWDSTDVTSTGGGALRIGGSDTKFIAIDNNEIQAIADGTAGTLFLNDDGGTVSVHSVTDGIFQVNTQDFYISAAGNVGIGTTTPDFKLEAIGDTNTDGNGTFGNASFGYEGSRMHIRNGNITFDPGNALLIGNNECFAQSATDSDVCFRFSATNVRLEIEDTSGTRGWGVDAISGDMTVISNRNVWCAEANNDLCNLLDIANSRITWNDNLAENLLTLRLIDNQVGIGTLVPQYRLQVAEAQGGTGEKHFNLSNILFGQGTNVGIGTIDPNSTLHVSGNTRTDTLNVTNQTANATFQGDVRIINNLYVGGFINGASPSKFGSSLNI